MLDKFRNLFAKPLPEPAQRTPPSAPLEVLVREGALLTEAPKIAGKTLSLLVASPNSTNTIKFESKGPRAHSNDKELQQFLALLLGARQFDALISQCRTIMYSPSQEGSIGSLGCLQGGQLHTFDIFELAPPPDLTWEIRRSTRTIHGHTT